MNKKTQTWQSFIKKMRVYKRKLFELIHLASLQQMLAWLIVVSFVIGPIVFISSISNLASNISKNSVMNSGYPEFASVEENLENMPTNVVINTDTPTLTFTPTQKFTATIT